MSAIVVLLLTLLAGADDGPFIDPNGTPRTYRDAALDGNGFDPHGTPRPTKTTANGDEGSGLDPHGGRRP